MMQSERDRFDTLVEQVIAKLPPRIRHLFEEAPLIIEDHPDPTLIDQMGLDPNDDVLCGLYTGTPLTERSMDDVQGATEYIHLFREGIVDQAGGWDKAIDDHGDSIGGEAAIAEEIRITILHEIGHHFGLEEDDLTDLGYD